DGELIHIANDAIEDEKLGIVYEIKVKPLKTTLNIDGEIKNIEPGMSVIAEVKVGKRRVIELFIYPIIKYLDEGLSVR
ncbi:HlyD family type I secretion periplasmic adaptor subunit, partial [Campylobacter ureolyticus]|nr:HlyD family type I secretion periplasmic adaptor subunit [Campylobacter ureolyticus]MCZ6164360.1 HlyD family type I secretion periplasmic adaptor subunit [Campylobacter ureolyticus]MCZ6166179.1 HlyD family type I secretion periplasmic adaptor subunit [Campylobacter ureolyticus]